MDDPKTSEATPASRRKAWRVLAGRIAFFAVLGGVPVLISVTPRTPATLGTIALKGLVFAVFFYVTGALYVALRFAAARSVGLQVTQVGLGLGPELGRVKAGEVTVSFHAKAYGFVAWTVPLPVTRPRLRLWIATAAGPFALVLCLAVVWGALGMTPSRAFFGLFSDPHVAPLASLFVVCVYGGIATLLPIKLPTRRGPAPTDGYRLIHLLFVSSQNLSEAIVAARAKGVVQLASTGKLEEARAGCDALLAHYPDSLVLGLANGSLLLEEHRFEDAHDVFLRLAAATDKPRLRALLENNAAWADVFIDGDAAAEEAVRLSGSAVRAIPDEAWAKSTRGAALVHSGEPGAGLAWLEDALPITRSPGSKAHVHAWLAIAHAGLRHRDEARRHLDEARALDATCHSLPQAEAALAALDAAERSAT